MYNMRDENTIFFNDKQLFTGDLPICNAFHYYLLEALYKY